MKRLAFVLLAFISASAFAQTNVRVRGTITALNGDVLSVKTREGKDVNLQLAPDAAVVVPKKGTAADFKPGTYAGITSVKGPDGRLVAKRVHALGPQVPQMHGNWDSIPGSMMTDVQGDMFTVDQKTHVHVGDKTEIVYTQPIALADIKPGDFLGVTSNKGAGGALTATEVRRFPQPLNPGHRPFDGRDDQTMTNASVDATVQSANGRELTMSYPGGSQKIVVPASASISTLVPGNRAQLVPGAPVSLTMDASG